MSVAAQSSPNLSVLVNPGTCLVPTGTYPTSYAYHCFVDTTGGETVTIGTPDTSNPRIDYIVAYVDESVTPNNTISNNTNNMFLLADVQGTPAASPVAPTVSQIQSTIGASNPYIILAQVYVGANVTQITSANITDERVLASTSNSNNGWQDLSGTLTYSANNGNREFVLDSNVNLSGDIQPGMKLAATRGIAPPTECMSFASASSQYASIASPAGLSFTSAFTIEAWVYLLGPTGTSQTVLRRDNGTSNGGFGMDINANGQVDIFYTDSAGTTTVLTSYQSLPYGQWVHLAGVVSDPTTYSATLYIDATSVPLLGNATNATSISNAGVLAMGADVPTGGTPTDFLNGYLSEVRLWGVALSQSQVEANMGINLVGTETNLVGLWPGNGSFDDLTSNGNTLTAVNSASAVEADNPFNAVEYGVVTAVTSTQVTVFTGTDCTIPDMTLTNPQYSIEEAPYGFPAGKDKWVVETIKRVDEAITVGSLNTIIPTHHQLSVPTGRWKLSHQGTYNQNNSTPGAIEMLVEIYANGSATTSNEVADLRLFLYLTSNTATFSDIHQTSRRETLIECPSMNIHGMMFIVEAGSGSQSAQVRGDLSQATLRAELAYD